MSEFIKTIDVLGDDAVLDSIINRTITEFKDDVVETVGKHSFRGCAALRTVDIPNAKRVDQEAFNGCTALVQMDCLSVERIETNAFASVGLKRLVVPRLTYVNTTAFQMSALESVEVPNLEGTARYVFQDCKYLTHVSAPKLPYIEIGVFSGCSALKEFDASPDIYSIRNTSFANSGIEVLILRNADSVATLEDANAFTNTPIGSGNGRIFVPESQYYYYTRATNWSGLAAQLRGLFEDEVILRGIIDGTIVHLNDNELETVPTRGFQDNQKLLSVNLPRCTAIGDSAFLNCTAVKSVNIPQITNVPNLAFKQCASLETVDFPLVTSIGRDSFQNCTSLREINFPLLQSVSGQNGYGGTFQGCSALTTVNAPSINYIGVYGFEGCVSLEALNCPLVTEMHSMSLARCTALKYVDVSSVTRLDGGVFMGDSALERLDFRVLETISMNNTFNGCSSLSELILRCDVLCTLNSTSSFTGTPIAAGTGYIYVPRALLSDTDATKDYRRATNWSNYATQFRALEDYTVDGTITGELDETKI